MNILAAILILGASGHAERSMTTDASIGRIVASVAWGAVSDVALRTKADRIDLGQAAKRIEEARIRLAIDGTERTGWRAWAEAGYRVGTYVADCRDAGSVGYAYQLQVRRFVIHRKTRITNDHVVLTTTADWVEIVPVGRSTKRIPIHVTIRITADERATGTLLVGTATGRADTGAFRCGLVRSVAERTAAAELNTELGRALLAIEREGRQFYAGGHDIADVLDGIHLGIGLAGRLRR